MDRRENLFNELERENLIPPIEQNPQPTDTNGQQYNANQPVQNSYPQQNPQQPRPNGYPQQNPQQPRPNSYPQQNPNGYQQYNANSQQYRYNSYQQPITPEQVAEAELKEIKKRSRRETTIVVTFIVLTIVAAAIGITGIVYDVVTSKDRIPTIHNSDKVVIFQNSKPEESDKIAEQLDEFGR
jgi:hypothetical protein